MRSRQNSVGSSRALHQSTSTNADASRKVSPRRTKASYLPSGKPKRPLSAYNLFFSQVHRELSATPGGVNSTLAKTVAERWNALDDKSHYQNEAERLRDEYYVDLNKWQEERKRLQCDSKEASRTTGASVMRALYPRELPSGIQYSLPPQRAYVGPPSDPPSRSSTPHAGPQPRIEESVPVAADLVGFFDADMADAMEMDDTSLPLNAPAWNTAPSIVPARTQQPPSNNNEVEAIDHRQWNKSEPYDVFGTYEV